MEKIYRIFLIVLFGQLVFFNPLCAQESFTEVYGITGADIYDLQEDAEGNMYVVSRYDGTVYKSEDGGNSWVSMIIANYVQAIFANGSDLYYATYDRLYKSADQGSTWTVVTTGDTFRNATRIYSLPNDPNTFVIQSQCEGVFVSTDGGINWVQISQNSGCVDNGFRLQMTSAGDIYFPQTNIGIIRHSYPNDGVWSVAKSEIVFPKDLVGSNDYLLSVGVNSNDKIYITYRENITNNTIFAVSQTGDFGTFSSIATPDNDIYDPFWSRSPSGLLYLLSQYPGKVWQLDDAVSPVWTQKVIPSFNYNGNYTNFFYWKSDLEVYAGGSPGLFYSTDASSTWELKNGTPPDAFNNSFQSDIEIAANDNLVVHQRDANMKGFWISTNQGQTFEWAEQSFGAYSYGNNGSSLLKLQDNTIVFSNSDGIRTSDDGINWVLESAQSAGKVTVSGNDILMVRNFNPNPAQLGISSNKGVSWVNVPITGDFATNFNLNHIFMKNNYIIIQLYNYENNLTEWYRLDKTSYVAEKLTMPFEGIYNAFELNNKIYISNGQKVGISSNNGTNWSTFNYNHGYMVPITQGTGGIGLSKRGSLNVTQDEGKSFKTINLDSESGVITDLVRDQLGTFYATCEIGPVVKFSGDLILSADQLPPSFDLSWEQKNGPYGGRGGQLLRSSSNDLYVGNTEMLFKQNEVSNSWERLALPNHHCCSYDMTLDNSDNIYFNGSGQLYTSSDGGATWTENYVGDAYKIRVAVNGNIIVGKYDNLGVSTDGGNSYQVPNGVSEGFFYNLEIDSNGILWASGKYNEISTLYKSEDNGLNWTTVSGIDLSGNKNVFSINILESGAIAIVTEDDIYKTTDGGLSWISIKANIPSTYNINDSYWSRYSKVYLSPANEYYFFNSIFLYKSSDYGANWVSTIRRSSLDEINGYYSYFTINDIEWYNSKMLISTENHGIMETVDDGTNIGLFQDNKGFYQTNNKNNLVIDGSVKLYIDYLGNNKIQRTEDDGESFSVVRPFFYLQGIKKSIDGNLIGYGNRFGLSKDKGITWTDLNSEFNGWCNHFTTPLSTGGLYYAATDNFGWRFRKSSDLISWSKVDSTGLPENYNIRQMEQDSNDVLYVLLDNYVLNKSELYAIFPFSGASLISSIENPDKIVRTKEKLYVLSNSKLYTSINWDVWEEKSIPYGNQLYVSENGYLFVANGENGECWLSLDEGNIWQNIGSIPGDGFIDIDIDMSNGYAYAIVENQPLLKSNLRILQNDNTRPKLESQSPTNNEKDVVTYFQIELNFDEAVYAVAGKKIRLYDSADESQAFEEFDVADVSFSNANKSISIKPTKEVTLGTTYFVIVDPDAFNDIFGNKFSGIINSSDWSFTISETPTLEPPNFDFDWEQQNGPYGGSAKQLVTDGSTELFVTNNEMLFKQNENTGSWERIEINNQFYEYSNMIIDDSNNLYFCGSGQLHKSTDGGTIWSSNYVDNVSKIRKANNGNLILANYYGIRYSLDDGVSFLSASGLSNAYYDHLEIDSNGELWTSGRLDELSTIYKSADNGVSWNTVNGIDLASNQNVLSINKLEDGTIAIVTTDNIYKTTDGGSSWSSILSNLPATYDVNNPSWSRNSKIYISPSGEYYFFNSLYLYKSGDYGSTWTELNQASANSNLNGFFTINDLVWYDSKMLVASEDNGILESLDDGFNFSVFQENKGFYQTYGQFNLVITNGSKIYINNQGGNKLMITNDDGQSYSSHLENTYVVGLKKLINGDLLTYGESFQLSKDGGSTWNKIDSDLDKWADIMTVPNGESGTYYVASRATGSWTFWKSDDLISWTEEIITDLPDSYELYQIESDSQGNLYLLLYDYSNNVTVNYIITSGVANLIDALTYPSKILRNQGKIYLIGYSQSYSNELYLSSDGINWDKKTIPYGDQFYLTENGYLFNTTEFFPPKCWLSADDGDTWQNVGGLIGDNFNGIEMDMSNGYAYAIAQNQPLLKSSNILLQNDKEGPYITSIYPALASDNVNVTDSLVINFNEVLQGIDGKEIRLYKSSAPNTPVESIDIAAITYSKEQKTVSIKPSVDLDYLTTYFVQIDEGAFTDIFGNNYKGILDNTSWSFSTIEVPDTEPPVLSFTTSDLIKGETKTYELSITDNKSIALNSIKIFHRGISTLNSVAFDSTFMSAVAGGSITQSNFTVVASDSWYDGIGLEFYFVGQDDAGNIVRLPELETEYFYSYIDYKLTQSRPDIEGMSFGNDQSSYRIITIPHRLANSNIALQFDELGASDKSNWRLFSYNGTAYDEFPDQLTTLERGRGYWVILKNSTAVFLENSKSPENNRDNFYSIDLKTGWNQVGNPYTVPISWEEVRSKSPTVIGTLKTYLDGVYQNGDVLNSFEGGFVFAQSDITVEVRFQGVTSGGRIEKVGRDISKENWDFPLIITQGQLGNEIGGIGMRTNANIGIDQYDDYNPPSFNQFVELRIKEADISNLAKSVVPFQPTYTWEFTVETNGTELSTLSWDNSELGFNDKELYLLDISKQRLINMRIENEYKFNAKDGNKFKLYFGIDLLSEIKPNENLFGNPFPNPTTDIINFPLAISEDNHKSKVSLSIYNSTGEKVTDIISGEIETGFYYKEINFDASRLPVGVYFSRWVIEDKNGNTATDMKKFIIK